ncbi:MAG: FGGY family carbohydrate kinase, partial [Victivallaceae bacterium]|nr:FGGY family carbohydrate kinase [Victivallaceae bacterium]
MSDLKLTIDLGSTEFKAAIYADGLRLLAAAGYGLSYFRNDAKAELPVNAVREAFRKVIERSVSTAGVDAKEINSIGITSQAQTFALADENGVFLTPFISWLDMRAAETYKTIPANDFAEHSSLAAVLPNMQIAILKHILDENPELARKKIRVVPLPAYLIMLLTGKSVSDNNLAAMSGLFSLKDNAYRQSLLNLFGIRGKNLPEIVEVGSIAGKVKNDNPFGIPVGKAVFSCGNDQTAGAYGAGLRPGDVLITLGTAQAVYRCCRSMPEPGSVQFRGRYPDGLYYAMSAGTGGGLISKAIAKIPAFKDFETFAGLAANADADIDAGFYVVNDEPGWSNGSAGLPEEALAVLNFLAAEIGDFFERITGNAEKINKIYVSGGGVKNRIWLKLIESKINKKLIIKDTSPCYGAAKMIQA